MKRYFIADKRETWAKFNKNTQKKPYESNYIVTKDNQVATLYNEL